MFRRTKENIEALMSEYNLSSEQFDELGTMALDALWNKMQAPDLLEALESLLICTELNLDDLENHTVRALENARAAITKAKGE